MKPVNVLGIIPARGGSKSIPSKNVAALRGRPLIAYTLDATTRSKTLTRTVVSTDDPTIAEVARSLGADVPFLRPADISNDDTPMLAVIQHSVAWLSKAGFEAEIIVLLQPTSPLRRPEDIDAAVQLLQSGDADTVVSVVEVPHQFTPQSLMEIKDGFLVAGVAQSAPILRRQDKVRMYARNGPAVLAMRRSVFESDRLYGDRILPLVMPRERSVDVDDAVDLQLAEFWLDNPNT